MGENKIVCQVKIHFKPFSILTQYCYVKLSALLSESGLFSERSNKF